MARETTSNLVTYWKHSSRINLLEHYARQVLIYLLYRTVYFIDVYSIVLFV